MGKDLEGSYPANYPEKLEMQGKPQSEKLIFPLDSNTAQPVQ
jgi:hypothetical protein